MLLLAISYGGIQYTSMELGRALELKALRDEQIKIGSELRLPENHETEQLVIDRFKGLCKGFANYVPHFQESGRYVYTRSSAMISVHSAEEPLPDVRLMLKYDYVSPAEYRGSDLEFNEFNEGIISVEVHWIHAPAGYFGNPNRLTNDEVPPEDVLTQGEVFAVERVNVEDLELGDLTVLSNKLRLIEESLDLYRRASEAA